MDKYICIVASGYPSVRYKRNGIFEWGQARALAEAGLKVVYAAVDLRSIRRKRTWGTEHFVRDGIEVYAVNVPIGAFPPDFCEFIGTIAFRLLCKRIFRDHGKPAVIHSHFLTPSVIASAVCKKEEIPLVLTEHSSALDKTQISKNDCRRAGKAYSQAAARIAVSRSFCKHLKESTGFDFRVIHNMVDLEAFVYRPKQENEKFTFAVTGNLLPGKGHRLLLKVFQKLLTRYPDTQLWIFGDGAESRRLKEQIASLGIEKNTEMFGNVERHIIGRRYACVDAFVLASEHETFGVAYIEAMAAGIPVIATRCGGPEEFVKHKAGMLVEVGDEKALYEAMEHMILCRDRYDRKRISNYAVKMFAPEFIAKEIIDVYKEILGEGSL